ncbi:TonB family protein [Paucibacter sp. O1-1]|uniref:TonB family protein n=1 Tax=Paucibacter sp. XJ19-41 TaxID=2927824 RepID=UPI0021D4E7AA|nr:TonB family protein [Paucibacter sp. XJ19-41]MCU7373620.1 TonB family protein [Paucibacter sp. O1-1]MDA3828621.1 TonB family protein [Paucibacter sp. O1-1]MDC6165997.1 TonB family protein [Paucibacter sp. XJ19-41]
MSKLSTLARVLAASALLIGIAAQAAAPKIIKKVPPEFPREAAQQSITSGVIKAKMSIDGEGKVTEVAIVEAEPRRVFDRAVTRALMDWRFEASGEKQTHEVKLVFRNEE